MGLNEIKWNLKMAYLPGTGAKQFLITNILDKVCVFCKGYLGGLLWKYEIFFLHIFSSICEIS
jgi:hypothetical protein